jgi:hypothetical protein
MHNPWTRKRSADEVPTPVAVAVADFCRRAGAPAPPPEVRDALSALAPAEDFRVRALTDAEPPARPLGPYAVVDVLGGTAPALAAQREACGYYLLAKELLASGGPAPAAPPLASLAEPPPAVAVAPPPSERPPPAPPLNAPRPPRAPAPTVAERIAPRRRLAGSRTEDSVPAPPRGRFTQLPAEQPALEMLDRNRLEDLIAQHGHRPALLRALGSGHAPGLTALTLDQALERAGLLDGLLVRERELILAMLEEHRGALGRAAWALGIRSTELLGWAERLGITAEVDRIRDRFRRDALQPVHWTARLDLAGKRKYLEDLGVTADFERSLARDLRRALDAAEGAPEDRTAVVASRLGVAPESLRRSLLRLGLLPGVAPLSRPSS